MEDDEQAPNIPSPNPNNNLHIQQQFLQLVRHWNHYKASSSHLSPSPTMLPRSQPEDDLISSLNRHGTPSSTWNIRTNQLAHDEIRRERRAAIASGNFKARRLSYDDTLDTDFLHGDYFNDFLHDQILAPSIHSSDSAEEKAEQVPVCLNALSYSSASSSSSSSSSGSFLPLQMKEQIADKVRVNVTPIVGEKREIGNRCKIGKWEVGLAWLAIASVAMIIFSLRCLGFGAYEEERFPFLLVPT